MFVGEEKEDMRITFLRTNVNVDHSVLQLIENKSLLGEIRFDRWRQQQTVQSVFQWEIR